MSPALTSLSLLEVADNHFDSGLADTNLALMPYLVFINVSNNSFSGNLRYPGYS